MESLAPHVLVVDDRSSNRAMMRMVLERAGYEVEEAATGRSALERLRASQEGLVALVDLIMPEMDGVQLLQAVEADKTLATHHAYIIVTGSMDAYSSEVEDLRTRLQVPLLEKPFGIDQLVALVDEAAERLVRRDSGVDGLATTLESP